jgi:hypothetical protein
MADRASHTANPGRGSRSSHFSIPSPKLRPFPQSMSILGIGGLGGLISIHSQPPHTRFTSSKASHTFRPRPQRQQKFVFLCMAKLPCFPCLTWAQPTSDKGFHRGHRISDGFALYRKPPCHIRWQPPACDCGPRELVFSASCTIVLGRTHSPARPSPIALIRLA